MSMSRPAKYTALLLIVALLATSCAGGNGTQGNNDAPANDGPLLQSDDRSPFPQGSVKPLQHSYDQATTLSFVLKNGKKYVDVDALVHLLEYENMEFDSATGVKTIGDKDEIIRLTAGSKQAEKSGMPFALEAAPDIVDGKMLLPASAATDLFQEEMVFDIGTDGIIVYPSDTQVTGRDTDDADEEVDDTLDFADDPSDPFAGEEESEGVFNSGDAADSEAVLEAMAADPEAAPALKNINMNNLIRTAKRYLGVKYKFGAGPYPRTNRFDCSSYTQYVFDKYGVNLPRTARAQSNVGRTVSRKNLRKGDLLFFYVPGRFKSNKIAGHVGIYIGNNRMIDANTEPKNGVQLRSINRAFWKKTFLRAKRVAY